MTGSAAARENATMLPRSTAAGDLIAEGTPPEMIVKRTRLRPDRVEAYESFHATIPAEVESSLLSAGVTQWRIWRSGRELVHVITVTSRAAMRARMAADPVIQKWNESIGGFLEELDPDSRRDMKEVWSLR